MKEWSNRVFHMCLGRYKTWTPASGLDYGIDYGLWTGFWILLDVLDLLFKEDFDCSIVQ